jgi:preprotein translocase SecE subunit
MIKVIKEMRLVEYFRGVAKEMKNVEFSNWQEVKFVAIVIVVIIAVMMLFVGFADFIVSKLIKALLGVA